MPFSDVAIKIDVLGILKSTIFNIFGAFKNFVLSNFKMVLIVGGIGIIMFILFLVVMFFINRGRFEGL